MGSTAARYRMQGMFSRPSTLECATQELVSDIIMNSYFIAHTAAYMIRLGINSCYIPSVGVNPIGKALQIKQ